MADSSHVPPTPSLCLWKVQDVPVSNTAGSRCKDDVIVPLSLRLLALLPLGRLQPQPGSPLRFGPHLRDPTGKLLTLLGPHWVACPAPSYSLWLEDLTQSLGRSESVPPPRAREWGLWGRGGPSKAIRILLSAEGGMDAGQAKPATPCPLGLPSAVLPRREAPPGTFSTELPFLGCSRQCVT